MSSAQWSTGGIFKGAAILGAASGVINLALYFVGSALGAAYLALPPEGTVPEAVPVVMPFVMSFVPSLLAGVVLFGLTKIAPNKAWPIFLGVLVVGFVLMLPGPVLQMGDDMVAVVVLELMHVVVVASLWLGMKRFARA